MLVRADPNEVDSVEFIESCNEAKFGGHFTASPLCFPVCKTHLISYTNVRFTCAPGAWCCIRRRLVINSPHPSQVRDASYVPL